MNPTLSSKAQQAETGAGDDSALVEENRRLRDRLAALEAGDGAPAEPAAKAGDAPAARPGRGKETRS